MRERGFELELEVSETNAGYRIEARSGVGGECVADTGLTPQDLLLEQRLQRLRFALLSSAAVTRRVPSRDEEAVQQLGAELFDKLFVGDVRTLFDTTRQQAAQQDCSVRLVLRLRSAEFAALPWEFLYDTRRDDYLSLSMPLVRYPEILETARPLRVAPPLRILGMSARPAGLDRLDVAAEKARLQRALSHLARDRRIELDWVQGETWRDLVHALNSGKWHVLHLIAHGGFDTVAGEGVFYLPGGDASTYCLRASRLAQVVNLHSSLRLILLNSCESALASTTDLFSSSAATLIRRGVPAVLAMQFEISDDAAIEFTSSFYEGVAFGQPIDVAVRNARLELSLARPNSLEWGTPVLYLRQSDGQIFDVAPTQAPVFPEQDEPESPRPVQPPEQPWPGPEPGPQPPHEPGPQPPHDPGPQRSFDPGLLRPSVPGPQRSFDPGPQRPPEPEFQPPPADVPYARVPTPGGPVRPPKARGDRGGRKRGSGNRRRLLVVAAAVVGALAVLLAVMFTSAKPSAPTRSAVVRVEANQPWTRTGVQVRAGQQYRIEATGRVSSESGTYSGPDGDAGRRNDSLVWVEQVNFAALLAKVGDQATPFFVGGGVNGRAETAGELLLGLNDRTADDNTGDFTVTIRLFS
ncbi:CHAT domain-containing protein [Streptomyces sclerotialus]|uniref:CHAT domain-containing protein n=1 Tax=Streptomyces sclerotialus TaxID=1957 RepID=UPI0004CC23FD